MPSLPRFGSTPFLLSETPPRLQAHLTCEYRQMRFEPVNASVERDPVYRADVIDGISSMRASTPDLQYAPMSASLMELAYAELTPLMEAWVGVPLERSWGYGVRSYGPGSWLHMHRDRVDTHVASCIVHVDDHSSEPWPLDFVDHEATHHQVVLKQGMMLFYESLCPHGRVSEFKGEFYRNMYFHWRPCGWKPQQFSGLVCKFPSLDEAQKANRQLGSGHVIPEEWRHWLILNRDRGCDRETLLRRAMAQGFARVAIEAILDASPSMQSSVRPRRPTIEVRTTAVHAKRSSSIQRSFQDWFAAPITRPDHQPRAWRVETPHVQLYQIPNFLSRQDCRELIQALADNLTPSTVTRGRRDYRTSRTCHLRRHDSQLAADLDQRLSALLGVDSSLSEPIQGQCYDRDDYFKEHTDWFAPGTEEFDRHTSPGGQRTWTVMVYLNAVEAGGETRFNRLNRSFTPVPGLALAWNNLTADGTPNPFTLHEALPVRAGRKWVITKWFRALPGRNQPLKD